MSEVPLPGRTRLSFDDVLPHEIRPIGQWVHCHPEVDSLWPS